MALDQMDNLLHVMNNALDLYEKNGKMNGGYLVALDANEIMECNTNIKKSLKSVVL